MRNDLDDLHHVGHAVRDLAAGLELYRRLGFAMRPPACPAMSPQPGAPPQPFGLANTHADFARTFVELVAPVGAGHEARLPAGVNAVPLHAPDAPREQLAQLARAVGRVVDEVVARVARFEGLHILALSAPDAERVAQRLDAAGVVHAAIQTARRPVHTRDGIVATPIRVMELSSAATDPLRATPEGRLAVAELPGAPLLDAEVTPDHPNGAVALAESILCTEDALLDAVTRRYEQYLGRSARADGATRRFDFERSRLTLVAASGLDAILPGERPPAPVAFVAYAVAVRDADAARRLVQDNGLPVITGPSGDTFVPAAAALGTSVIFRQAG